MGKLLLKIFLVAGAVFLVANAAHAQTCRVNIGTNASGCASYMEVFEYDYVTDKPSFPGGDGNLMKFINANRQYPKEAYKKGIQGRVTCAFVVNADGSVTHISILRGVEPSLNKEAIRVLSKMPEWTPGRLDGKPVPVRVIWSVPFRR